MIINELGMREISADEEEKYVYLILPVNFNASAN